MKKLVRNQYRRSASQFLILASSKGNSHCEQELGNIREFFYHNRNSTRGVSFKQFLDYLQEAETYDNLFGKIYETDRKAEKKISLKRFGRIKLKYLFAPPFLDDVKGDLRIEKISEDTFTNVNQFPTVESFYDDESIQLVNDLFSEDLPCVDIGK